MPQMGDWYWGTQTAATTSNQYVTITNTWDNTSAAPRPIVWNGAEVVMGAPVEPAPPLKEKAVDWLRRRVEEYRVPLLEAA